ncbi:MAG: GNAT family N-acetyltransferase [Chloroflexi bacterium]|nr:GNAT family N-acetyltransferase [Chloroflexota bacterium]
MRQLFGALHSVNAALDPTFALAEGWEDVLSAALANLRQPGEGLILLAWLGAEPVGLLIMSRHRDSLLFRHRNWAELLALYVVPKARHHGVADALLAAGVNWARARGYDRVQLYVTTGNHRAKRFYSGCGFRCAQEIWRLDVSPAGGIGNRVEDM